MCCFGEAGLGGGELVEEVDVFAAEFVGPEEGGGGWVPGPCGCCCCCRCWCVFHGCDLFCLVGRVDGVVYERCGWWLGYLEWVELR